jgi:hypothetical protein
MSLIDRLGGVVKAEWNARFGEDDEDFHDDAADEGDEKATRKSGGSRPARRARSAASAQRVAVSDLESAWRLLELNKGATLDEVRAAYRRLARHYHPRTLSKVADQAYAAQTLLDALTDAVELLEAHLLPLPAGRG